MAEGWIQVAIDGAGKKVRNLLLNIAGTDVYQQVVTLAKSDGSLITPTTPADTQPVSVAALPLPAGAAADASLATLHTDLAAQARLVDTQPVTDAAIGTAAAAPAAFTVLDRISKVAQESTMQKVLAAIQAQSAKPATKSTTTLLHRS